VSVITITIPQLGEGLREVRLVRFLKQVGESVGEEDPLYEAETEKAVVLIESPCSGTLTAWHFAEGDTAPVYAPLAEITPVTSSRPPSEGRISPRVRALAKRLLIPETTLTELAQNTQETLTESFLENWHTTQHPTTKQHAEFEEIPLSEHQRQFNRRAFGDSFSPVPATLKLPISWDLVQATQKKFALKYPTITISEFQVIAYAVVLATKEHPLLRSKLMGREMLRQYKHLTLGFAARRGQDELTTVMVSRADTLSFLDFSQQVNTLMREVARRTELPADESATLLISYMASFGVTDAVPVLTAPAAAVLFVGAPQNLPDGLTSLLVLTFDHRILNGVGTALFLKSIVISLEKIHGDLEINQL
jgi:pyruvate/2-oxoglutarate dehydrogenase complex dihydrolipoamide acyltransferase (E2) component